MPYSRWALAARRFPHVRVAQPPPGGRVLAWGLVILGLGLLAIATAPLGIAGAQTAPATAPVESAPPNGQFGSANFCAPIPCDPGPRKLPPAAGGAMPNLTSTQMGFFTQGQTTFEEVDTVSNGLGPRFNMNSCAGCHAYPAVGGSSPPTNPQAAITGQSIPSFITATGPVREVRFVKNADGTPDGGVHDLFVNPGCGLSQPDFAGALGANNAIFRIPTPTFGAGLIEAIPDATIVANMKASAGQKAGLGISGRTNNSGNDGTVTRFGWKAQNKSLVMFAGEAYNVEQGVTNEVFPNERDICSTQSATPEDFTGNGGAAQSDVTQFGLFMQMLAPPTAQQPNPFTQHGQQVFSQAGCDMCHTPSLTTGPSTIAALSNQKANLYSDLLIHDMGSGLADNISQGGASGNEFRTAPLWGVGQRLFFLHDGRTSDLMEAIQQHASSGSEANQVVGNFNNLNTFDKETLLVFLRSL